MPATREFPAFSGLGHVPHLESSRIEPDQPPSQPCIELSQDAAVDRQEHCGKQNALSKNGRRAVPGQQTLGCSLEEAASRGNPMGHCPSKCLFPEVHFRLPIRHIQNSRQAGSNASMNPPEMFESRVTQLATGVTRRVMAISVPEAVPGTEDPAPALQVATRKGFETIGSFKTNKRKREVSLDPSNHDNASESSYDSSRRLKKVKVDCDCDTDHSWWMTIKIGDMNEAIQQLTTGMELARKFEHQSIVPTGNLLELLKKSQEILESAKDDMRAEGGRDRDA